LRFYLLDLVMISLVIVIALIIEIRSKSSIVTVKKEEDLYKP